MAMHAPDGSGGLWPARNLPGGKRPWEAKPYAINCSFSSTGAFPVSSQLFSSGWLVPT